MRRGSRPDADGPAGPVPNGSGDDTRARLRRAARKARRGLTGHERLAAEERLQHHLLSFLAAVPVGTLALSVATDGEPDLTPLVGTLRARGWRLALPVVGGDGHMTFGRWEPDTPLEPDRYGIPTPVGAEPVGVDELDVVVVPCVAVDPEGNRLGFGAGYYDRVLGHLRDDALVVAAVFSDQVVDDVPAEEWDVRTDAVVTDRGVVRDGGAGSGRA